MTVISNHPNRSTHVHNSANNDGRHPQDNAGPYGHYNNNDSRQQVVVSSITPNDSGILSNFTTRYEEIILSRRQRHDQVRDLLRDKQRLLAATARSLPSSSSSPSSNPLYDEGGIQSLSGMPRMAPRMISSHTAMNGMLHCALLEAKKASAKESIVTAPREEAKFARGSGASAPITTTIANRTKSQGSKKQQRLVESIECLMEETLYIQDYFDSSFQDIDRDDGDKNEQIVQPGDKNSNGPLLSLGYCLEVEALVSFSLQQQKQQQNQSECRGHASVCSEETSLSGYDSEQQVEDFFQTFPEYCHQGSFVTTITTANNTDIGHDDDDDDKCNHDQDYRNDNHHDDTNGDSHHDGFKYNTDRHSNTNGHGHGKNTTSTRNIGGNHIKNPYLPNSDNSATSQCPFRTAQELLPGNGFETATTTSTSNSWSNVPPSTSTFSYDMNQPQVQPYPHHLQPQQQPPSQPQQNQVPISHRPQLSAGLKRKFQIPKPRPSPTAGDGHHSSMKRQVGATGTSNSGMPPHNKHTSTYASQSASSTGTATGTSASDDELPEELRGLDKELVAKIENEIVDSGECVSFRDIAGLESAKQTVMELVCWPMKRPDLFTGLRRGPNGLLLFGPPGTGKTLIGKAIACESGATFFSISSSSLTSKWIGEGEKLVRTLFAVAAYREPSVVFIDEIDSLLTQRKADENEASRRIKTEFLVQLDGTGTSGQGRVLAIGATNRPHELDDAARRRFVKRLYIPLPEAADREVLLRTLLEKNKHCLSDKEIWKLSNEATKGFSGADLKALCTDAALGPIRELGARALEIDASDVPPISYKHFRHALKSMNPSVSQADLQAYVEFNNTYGSKSVSAEDYKGLSDEDDDDDDNKGS